MQDTDLQTKSHMPPIKYFAVHLRNIQIVQINRYQKDTECWGAQHGQEETTWRLWNERHLIISRILCRNENIFLHVYNCHFEDIISLVAVFIVYYGMRSKGSNWMSVYFKERISYFLNIYICIIFIVFIVTYFKYFW